MQELKNILNLKYQTEPADAAAPGELDPSAAATDAVDPCEPSGAAAADAADPSEPATEPAAVVAEAAPATSTSPMDNMDTLPLAHVNEPGEDWPPNPSIPKTSLQRWTQPKRSPTATSAEESILTLIL